MWQAWIWFYRSPRLPHWPKQRQILQKRALIASRLVVHSTKRKSLPQDLHKMTLTWASSICCCSITCHFELGRHKSKLFSTFSTNGNVPNNTSSFYLHLLKGALKNYIHIFSLTLHIIFSQCRSFLMDFTPKCFSI